MSSKLEFTGERFTPECEREIWYEHMHRYAFAAALCRGRHVLDAACGEGYGSALLAGAGANVVGADISEQAIAHARARYGELAGLAFEVADCTRLPFTDGQFDAVVSFETLEHLDKQDAMLSEFRRVLTAGGFLLLSSPDKAVYTDELGIENEFHVRELYRDELERLLGAHFPACRLMGQKLLFHSAIWALDGTESVGLQQMQGAELRDVRGVGQAPVYFIALCAANQAALPGVAHDLWLFDDAEESVYRHYLGEIRRNMAAGGIIAERDREIEDLKKRLDDRRGKRRHWLRRLLGGS